MKQRMVVGMLVAGLGGFCGCGGSKSTESLQPVAPAPGSAAPGSATPGSATPGSATGDTPHMMTGAYGDGDANSDDAKKQAAKAIELLRTAKNDPSIQLSAIRSFSQQVVAGMNYKMGLDVTTAAGPKTVNVVMYVDLRQNATLTTVDGM